jgi:hypothetical protein
MTPYIDSTSQDFGMGWTLTNENPNIYRGWAERISPNKAFAISSGGEIPLLALLPIGCEVTAVDISYNSIRATMAKIALVKKYGKELKTKLHENQRDFEKFVDDELVDEMPESLRENAGFRIVRGYDWMYNKFAQIWMNTPDNVLEAAQRNIGNISLVHGDIEEVQGEDFDLIYVANTLDTKMYGVSKKIIERRGLKHVIGSNSLPNNLTLVERIDDSPKWPLEPKSYFWSSIPETPLM